MLAFYLLLRNFKELYVEFQSSICHISIPFRYLDGLHGVILAELRPLDFSGPFLRCI